MGLTSHEIHIKMVSVHDKCPYSEVYGQTIRSTSGVPVLREGGQ